MCAKNFPVNIAIELYTLRLLILPNTCSKVRNSVFDTNCTVDSLDIVHTGGHADIYHLLQLRDNKVSFHEVTPFYLTLRTVNKI